MKKKYAIFLFLFVGNIDLMAQDATKNDSVNIFKNDIYSNFNKDVYAPSKDFKVFINKKGDSVKVLSGTYDISISKADEFLKNSDFTNALFYYNKAFKDNHDLGKVKDRYKAACCYAMLNDTDSAFLQLDRIVSKEKYYNIEEIESEAFFKPLHKDVRWKALLLKIRKNRQDLKEELDKATPQN